MKICFVKKKLKKRQAFSFQDFLYYSQNKCLYQAGCTPDKIHSLNFKIAKLSPERLH